MYKYFLIKIYLKDFPFIIIIIQYFKKKKRSKAAVEIVLYYVIFCSSFVSVFNNISGPHSLMLHIFKILILCTRY